MRQQHIKPLSRPVELHNYLPEDFTFYWDQEAYTIKAGKSMTMFEWLAIHGAMKMAERFFTINPTNKDSADPKTRGFYSRHDDIFKDRVKKAIIYPEGAKTADVSQTATSIAMMNDAEEEEAPKTGRPAKKTIELPEVEDEIIPGCQECKATGPRHKPTCSKYKTHDKDATQAPKLS